MLEWLKTEFEMTRAKVRPHHEAWLAEQGVPASALEAAGGFGVARIRASRGLFDFVGAEGDPALVLPVHSADVPPHGALLVDLVAFSPNSPERFHRRRLDAVWLGEDAFELARFWRCPVTVHRTPLSWLKAGARGAVPLDWTHAPADLLDFQEIHAEDEDFAREIDARLRAHLLRRMPFVRREPEPMAAAPALAAEHPVAAF